MLELILFLQKFDCLDEFWQVVTFLGDPKQSMLALFPLVFWSHPRLGIRLLTALVAADLVNAILKWPARGDRPYDCRLYLFIAQRYVCIVLRSYWFDPRVREFWMTCETGSLLFSVIRSSTLASAGFGMPSGHVMVSCACYLVIAHGLRRFLGKVHVNLVTLNQL